MRSRSSWADVILEKARGRRCEIGVIRSSDEARDGPVRMRRDCESSHDKLRSDGLAVRRVLEDFWFGFDFVVFSCL